MARSIGTRMSAPGSVGSAINKPIDVLSRLKSACLMRERRDHAPRAQRHRECGGRQCDIDVRLPRVLHADLLDYALPMLISGLGTASSSAGGGDGCLSW
jgi:hypothetical protein